MSPREVKEGRTKELDAAPPRARLAALVRFEDKLTLLVDVCSTETRLLPLVEESESNDVACDEIQGLQRT